MTPTAIHTIYLLMKVMTMVKVRVVTSEMEPLTATTQILVAAITTGVSEAKTIIFPKPFSH